MGQNNEKKKKAAKEYFPHIFNEKILIMLGLGKLIRHTFVPYGLSIAHEPGKRMCMWGRGCLVEVQIQ